MLRTLVQDLAAAFPENYPVPHGSRCDDRIKPTQLTAHWAATFKRVAEFKGLCFRRERKRFDGTLYLPPDFRRVLARIEWENQRLIRGGSLNKQINELEKLKRESLNPKFRQREGFFCCFIGYVEQDRLDEGLRWVQESWEGAGSQLLLVLGQYEMTRTEGYKKNKWGRGYRAISFFEINPTGPVPNTPLLTQPWRGGRPSA